MFLNNSEQQLNVHLKVRLGEGPYAGFASTGSLLCFECGDLGHKSFACPNKGRRQGEDTIASGGNRGQHARGHETQAAEAGPSHAIEGGVEEAGATHAK